MLFNIHTHTEHSHDATAKLDEICRQALRCRLSGFAVTDHCDCECSAEPRAFDSLMDSFEDCRMAKERYAGRLVIAAGVLLLGPAVSVLKNNPVAKPAFAYVLPALFGALGASYFRKNVAVSLITIGMGCAVLLFAPSIGVGTLIFVTIIVAIGSALGMFKLGWIK